MSIIQSNTAYVQVLKLTRLPKMRGHYFQEILLCKNYQCVDLKDASFVVTGYTNHFHRLHLEFA